jgi:transcriptional regulator with XRE-family HTH domain
MSVVGYESTMTAQLPPIQAVADAVRSLRADLGWSQRQLASRAGLSQAEVWAVENGVASGLTFATAERLLDAMGARLAATVDLPYLGDRIRQRDPSHARCSAAVVTRLRRAGWDVRSEVEVGGDRSRGWIDVLAVHPATGLMLVIEIKTEIHDLGAIERSLGWYEREAWVAARGFGWRPAARLGCLILLATEANDVRVRANRAAFDVGFPVRARTLNAIVQGGADVREPGRGVAMVDPHSKRRDWLRPLRVDGRRSPSPYVDYADFVRAAGLASRSRPPSVVR